MLIIVLFKERERESGVVFPSDFVVHFLLSRKVVVAADRGGVGNRGPSVTKMRPKKVQLGIFLQFTISLPCLFSHNAHMHSCIQTLPDMFSFLLPHRL